MKKIFVLNKKEGETPLEALEGFRGNNKKYEGVKMTYAGRLDPLVSGLLLVLIGDSRYEKEKYLKLPKEYEFEVIFGFATDTYDILGKVVEQAPTLLTKKELEGKINKNLRYFRGKFLQKYPMYSSRTVAGRPLFSYARAGVPVESPEREVHVMELEFLGIKKIGPKLLLKNIERRIAKVKGDFRQREILKIWTRKLGPKMTSRFFAASFRIKCSSGTYVRAIANDLGIRIGIPSLALTIKRTKIGKIGKAGPVE